VRRQHSSLPSFFDSGTRQADTRHRPVAHQRHSQGQTTVQHEQPPVSLSAQAQARLRQRRVDLEDTGADATSLLSEIKNREQNERHATEIRLLWKLPKMANWRATQRNILFCFEERRGAPPFLQASDPRTNPTMLLLRAALPAQ